MQTKFSINEAEGLKYAQESGDYNKIHLDDLIGYNSIYGQKICHGTLVILKSLKLLKIGKLFKNKRNFFINFKFNHYFEYNKNIYIDKKFKKISQKRSGLIEFEYGYKEQENSSFVNSNFKKTSYFQKIIFKSQFETIRNLLNNISKFVGMKYPGDNSIISSINIRYNINFNYNKKKINIFSKKKSGLPIIYNKLVFDKYEIDFVTFIRPSLRKINTKINKRLEKLVKNLTDTILIIGSSSGIGLELLRLFEKNKKIKIYATYFKNKIKNYTKNTRTIKFNVNENLKKIKKIIEENKNIRIFYMSTPKIVLDNSSKNLLKKYEKYYVNIPIEILNLCKNNKVKFFYPSSIYVNKKKNHYTKTKILAEKKLNKLRNSNLKINFLRIQEINTKQNLSILNIRFPSFISLLNKNLKYQKKLFFL